MTITEKIIDKIRRNRISTTEVADCLGKTGAIPDVAALNRGHFQVGPVFFAYAYDCSNWPLHEQIEAVPEGSIVLMEAIDCDGRAPIGELVAKFLVLYRQCRALVVRAPVRDAPHLIKENWPVWCRGVTPVGCFNVQVAEPPTSVLAPLRQRYDGAIAVCDDCGVVLIERTEQSDDLLAKLDAIEEQEDIWFDCIDRRKWTTYETVCLKKYLADE